MDAPEKRDHPIRVFLLKEVVDIEQSVGDQLHPQFFNLMDDLELQLVAVAEGVEVLLTGEQRFRVEINLVIERAFAVHDGVVIVSVQGQSPGCAPSSDVEVRGGRVLRQITLHEGAAATLSGRTVDVEEIAISRVSSRSKPEPSKSMCAACPAR